MNTFSLHVCIILGVIAAIHCAPGFNGKQSADQQRNYLEQLLQMMEVEAEDDELVGEDALLEAMEEEEEAEEEGFNNNPDGTLKVECNAAKGEALSRVKSEYSIPHGDRKWEWICTKVSDTAMSDCTWTNYLNDFDKPFGYTCPQDFVMCGVISVHQNSKEDRRWRVKCCRAKGYQTESCELSSQYINEFRGAIDFEVHCEQQTKIRRAFTGLYSYDDNTKHDRRWKIYQCEYSKA